MSDTASIQEVFNELFTHLEKLETRSEGILLYLKEKKRVTDKQLAPYMEQAGNASNVKWRAARVRVERLLTAKDEEDKAKESVNVRPEIAKAEQEQNTNKQEEKKQSREQSNAREREQPAEQVASPELEAAVQSHSKHEPERKSAVETDQSADRKAQEPKREEINHPTEMSQEIAQHDRGKPADEMKPEDKNKDQEAA